MDLIDVLSAHRGKNNAIKSSSLEAMSCCTGSEIRKKINTLRCDGYPICSSSNGYFYATTAEETRETINQLNNRIRRISSARDGMAKSLRGEVHG